MSGLLIAAFFIKGVLDVELGYSDEKAAIDTESSSNVFNSNGLIEASVDSPQNEDISIPFCDERFYLSNLNEKLKEDAQAVYIGFSNCDTTIQLPNEASWEDANLLLEVMKYDCPELFHVSFDQCKALSKGENRVVALNVEYSMTKDEYENALNQCNEKIDRMVSLTKKYNEDGKEEYVYEQLTDTVNYNTEMKQSGTAYGALINKEAKCDGISLAVKWIFEKMNMPTIVICGSETGKPYGHAWNCVKINGDYYDLDLTNDLRNNDRSEKLYSAYNVKRSWLSDNYPILPSIVQNFDLPEASSMKKNYYVRHGAFIKSGEYLRTLDLIDEVIEDNIGRIQFETDSDYQWFMKNYKTIFEEWFYQNDFEGSYQISSVSDFRTICFELSIE